MTKRLLAVVLPGYFAISFLPQVRATTLQLEAARLFEQSLSHHLRFSEKQAQIELESGELFEDDGPASGHSYQKPENRETVSSQIWIKKELVIPNPQAEAAFLVVLSETPFEAIINGVPQRLGTNLSGRTLSKTYAFDPQLLRPGPNEVILRNSGKVWIARDDEFALGSRTRTKHPNRSAKSTDAGKTWDYDCESFGIPGRVISISQGRQQEQCPGGGHEIVELWSNDYKKWVYVDGALAWYIVDPKTGIPLSIWELRQRQLPTLRGKPVEPAQVVAAERTRNKQFVWKGLAGPEPLNWYLELRMIPRSNFLQQQSPLPLNQGTDEWCWTGHYVWTDSEVPAGFLFSHRVSKRNDFQWTLNQAHYVLEPTPLPGRFRVHLDTETPSFETFLAEIDGGAKRSVSSGFTWTLHPGKNYLRVRPQNVSGREGIPSWIALDYAHKMSDNR